MASVVAGVMTLALGAPVGALADSWTLATGPIAATAGSSASLSVTNISAGPLFLEIGVFGVGDTDDLGAGQTYTSTANCSGSGCRMGALVVTTSPDIVPALHYSPLGSSQPVDVPAGGFVSYDDEVGVIGDFLSVQANAATAQSSSLAAVQSSLGGLQTAVSSVESTVGIVESAVAAVQTSLTSVSGMVGSTASGVAGLAASENAVQSSASGVAGQLGTVQGAAAGSANSDAAQFAALDAKVGALTAEVSKLRALVKPSRRPKPKRKL